MRKKFFLFEFRPFYPFSRFVLCYSVLLYLAAGFSPGWSDIHAQTPISLEECRIKAIEHNQQIQSAAKQADAAKALSKAALTNFLPNFSINGIYTHLNKDFKLTNDDLFLPVVPYSALTPEGKLNPTAFQDPAIASSMLAFDPVTHQVLRDASGNPIFRQYAWLPASKAILSYPDIWVVNAGLVQPIFMGGKILETWKIATINHKIAKNAVNYQTSDVLYNAEYYYWSAVSVREKVKLAGQYYTLLEQLHNDVVNYFQEGIITQTDLLKVEVKLEDAELQLLKAQNGEKLAIMALCRIIGMPLNSQLQPVDSLEISYSYFSPDSLVSVAKTYRPELLMLKDGVDLARHNTLLMRSRFLPNLAFTANSIWLNPDPFNGMQKQFGNDINVGIAFNIPLFHWGERFQTLKAAHLQEEAAQLKYQEASSLVELEINQAWLTWKEAIKKAAIAGKTLKQAQENLRLCNDKFHEGILKVSDVLEAQTLYQQAWSEKIEAETELRFCELKLRKATGELAKNQ